jgi:hypothetical protein
MKAATVAVQPTEHPMSEHDDYEPEHAASPTDQIAQELQLYGYRPSEDEADPRPLPEDRIIEGAVADIFDALISTVADTSLDPDLDDLLWSTVNMFHRAVERATASSTTTSRRRNGSSANRTARRSNPSSSNA